MSVSDARATLPDLLDRVARGEEITITRHGTPVAVLVRPEALRRRRAAEAFAEAAKIREMIERGRHTRLEDLPPMDPAWADELVAEIRADRDRE